MTIIKIICLILVILQTFWTIKNKFYSGKTFTNNGHKKLNDIEFPIVLNIIVKPGFDIKKLKENGYKNV